MAGRSFRSSHASHRLPSYLQLRDNAEVLEADGHGDKVLRLRDGSFLKLFRRKRLISSAALFPYAERFARNASELARRGIVCPKVLDVLRIPHIQRDAVHYEPLPGQTLRQLDRNDPECGDTVRTQLGELIAALHAKGCTSARCTWATWCARRKAGWA